eukprot:TRINITY_DN25382_c0_g1_i1.p1 TRINITY_DN25382_c0_g1~~TRINITY_DN25382_c0_g1_i1.p1  ORF type:complete len:450 (+),score=71.88 TRINITY_DN25382_c0_g1_i1:54-1403(+)
MGDEPPPPDGAGEALEVDQQAGVGKGPKGELNYVANQPWAPKAVDPPADWRERLKSTTVYSYNVVNKINGRKGKDKRYVICSSLFLAIFDEKRNVKRVYPYYELTDLMKDSANNQLLIKATNPPGEAGVANPTTEPDVVIELTDHADNDPKTLDGLIDVITKMCKAIPPNHDVKVKEVEAGASLKMAANCAGQKVDVLEKKKRLLLGIKDQEIQASRRRAQEEQLRQQEQEEANRQAQAQHEEAMRQAHEALLAQQEEEADDSDDPDNPDFHSGALRGAPIAGQIDRQSLERSSHVASSRRTGRVQEAHPRWNPDAWRENNHMMRPVPTDGAEPEDWRMISDDGSWFNTRTGVRSNVPPKELYDDGRRFNPTLVEPHSFARGSGSPRNGGRRVIPWVPATAMSSPRGYRGVAPNGSSPSYGSQQGGSPVYSPSPNRSYASAGRGSSGYV